MLYKNVSFKQNINKQIAIIFIFKYLIKCKAKINMSRPVNELSNVYSLLN